MTGSLLRGGAPIKGGSFEHQVEDGAHSAELLLELAEHSQMQVRRPGEDIPGRHSGSGQQTIEHGVPKAKEHTGAMPPKGGANLSQADVTAVADYVWALGHRTTQ